MKTKRTIWLVVTVMVAIVSNSNAGLVNLTTDGSSGWINGAFFEQHVFDRSTGTGVFEPFVRLQIGSENAGIERGYNTIKDNEEWETKAGKWTHPIQLNAIPVVDKDGTDYYELRLDINESGNDLAPLVSLVEMKIHVVSEAVGGGLTNYWNANFGPADWDLGDNRVNLNFNLDNTPGSGGGDMIALIPVSALGTTGTDYIYLYSKFGTDSEVHIEGNEGIYAAGDGFEEWGVVVPEPATMIILGLGSILLRKSK
jgi:hypothetical protein